MARTEEEQALADKLTDAGPTQEDAEKWVDQIVESAFDRGYNEGWSHARG